MSSVAIRKVDDFVKSSGVNFGTLNSIDNIFIDGIKKFSSYHSGECYKHFQLLVSLSIINCLKNLCSKTDKDKYIEIVMKIIMKISDSINNPVAHIGNKLIDRYIIKDIQNNFMGIHLTKDQFDSYRELYIKLWGLYNSVILNGVRLIILSYFNNVCKDQLRKKNFFYILLSSISDFVWIKNEKMTSNKVKENIKLTLSKVEDPSTFINPDTRENYTELLINHTESCYESLFSETAVNNNVDIKPLDYIFEFYFKMIFVFFDRPRDQGKYIVLKNMLERAVNVKEFVGLIFRFTNGYKELMIMKDKIINPNKVYIDTNFLSEVETEYIFTCENLTLPSGNVLDFTFPYRRFQYIPPITHDEPESLLLKYLLKKEANTGIIKLFGKYTDYGGFDNIFDVIDNRDIIGNKNYITYTLESNQSHERVNFVREYLELFNIGRLSEDIDISLLSKDVIQKLKIIKMIVNNKEVWIIDNVLSHVDEDTKRIIIKELIKLQIKGKKTLMIYDPELRRSV